MKKRMLLSMILMLALLLVFLPGLSTEAEAAASSSVTINGTTLSSGYYLRTDTWTQTTAKPLGSYFHYMNGTLTMHNVSLTASDDVMGIGADGDLRISLSGTNSLTTKGATGIYANGKLIFTGSGTLTVNNTTGYSIRSTGNMEFSQTGKVSVTSSNSNAIVSGANITISGNLSSTCKLGSAILAERDLTINSGTVTATSTHSAYQAILVKTGSLYMNGGSLTVSSVYEGIRLTAGSLIQGGGTVSVTSSSDTGVRIISQNAAAILNGGTLNVSGAKHGIHASRFRAAGGTAHIKSTNTASDSSYSALKLAGITSSDFVQRGNIVTTAATTANGTLLSFSYDAMNSYDYIFVTSRVYVNGVEIRDGQYLASGKTSPTTTKPSSGGYVHYAANTLTMNNYTGSNTGEYGILSGYDLTIQLEQGSVNRLTTSSSSGFTLSGIRVTGNLTIKGAGQLNILGGKYAIQTSGNLNANLATLICDGGGISTDGKLNFDNAYVLVNQLKDAASNTHAVEADGTIVLKSGLLCVDSPKNKGSSYNRGIVGNGITISGSVDLNTYGMGIMSTGDISITAGTVNVYANKGTAIYTGGTVRISGGVTDAQGFNDGVYAGKFILTDGVITARSFDPNQDPENWASKHAIHLPANTTTYFQIPEGCGFSAVEYYFMNYIDAMYNAGTIENLGKYHYVSLGDFVDIHGVIVPSGYYIAGSGNAKTITATKPSGNSYVYYEDGVLTMNNFTYDSKMEEEAETSFHAVLAFQDLTIVQTGINNLNSIVNFVGDLTLDGSGILNVSFVKSEQDITINNGTITLRDSYHGISCGGNLTVNGGYTEVNSLWYAINFGDSFTVTDGVITASVKNDAEPDDLNIYAIKSHSSSPTFHISGMNHVAGYDPTPGTIADTSFLSPFYDYVAIGDFALVRGVLVPEGYYLANDSSTPTSIAPSGGYAYYSGDGLLILYNYSFSGKKDGIVHNADDGLTISLYGTNRLDVKGNDHSGITVQGDLTIQSGSGSVDQLIVNSEKRYGISCGGNLSVTSDIVSVTAAKTAVTVGKDFQLTGNCTVNVTCTNTDTSAGYDALYVTKHVYVTDGALHVSGSPVYGNAVNVVNGNFQVSKGIAHISAPASKNGTGILVQRGNLNLSGGELHATGYGAAMDLRIGKLNVTGGYLTATSTGSDSSIGAIRLAGSSDSYYGVSSTMSAIGSRTATGKTYEKLAPANLANYDYVQIGKFIMINGKTLMPGYSVNGSGNVVSGNGGSGYAYYQSSGTANTLTLNNFVCNSAANSTDGIHAFTDLTIQVNGASGSSISSGSYTAILVEGDLTLTGSGTLSAAASGNAVVVRGELTVTGPWLSLTSARATALFASGNVTVNSGSLKASGGKYGIDADYLNANGGELTAISTDYTSGATDGALDVVSLRCADGMYAAASTGSAPKNAEVYLASGLPYYNYVYVGDYVLVGGVILPDGQYLVKNASAPVTSTSATAYAFYKNGTLTLKDFTPGTSGIGVDAPHSLVMTLNGTNTMSTGSFRSIYVLGNLEINGSGSLQGNSTSAVTLGATGNILLKDATLNLTSTGESAIQCGNLTVESGSLTGTSTGACEGAVEAKNMTVSGGRAIVTGKQDGVRLTQKFTMNGGSFAAYSSDSSTNDIRYQALRAAETDLSAIAAYCKLAGTAANSDTLEDYDPARIASYDLLRFEPQYINVKGIGLPDKCYLSSSGNTVTASKPSGGYAYRDGNKVYLHNFVYSGSSTGVYSNGSVELVLSGSNTLSTGSAYCVNVGAKLTVSGTGSLSMSGSSTLVICYGGFETTDADLTLNAQNHNGIYVMYGGNITVNSGNVTVTSKYNAFSAQNVVVNGGTVLLKSTDASAQEGNYSAIMINGTLTVADGLEVYGDTVSGGSNAEQADPSKLKTYDYIRIEAKPEPVIGYTESGAAYNVRLIEPWAIRVNVRYKDADGGTINVADMANYGAVAVRGSLLGDVSNVTTDQILASPYAIRFDKGTEASGGMFPTGDGRAAFHFFEGLYTYRLDEEVYWFAWFEDDAGNRYYTKVRNKSLHTLMNDMISKVSANEADVYRKMLTMEEAIKLYRGNSTSESVVEAAKTVANCGITFGQDVGNGKYKFGKSYRISLIEPWGILLNTRIYDNTDAYTGPDDHIDYANADNYGMIIYHDKTGALAGTMDDYNDLLALPGAYVYSKNQGNMHIDGTKVYAAYNKDIFTYELDSTIYCVTFLEVDGEYYYSTMTSRNLYELMGKKITDNEGSAAELEVYKAMRAMYNSITTYRAAL